MFGNRTRARLRKTLATLLLTMGLLPAWVGAQSTVPLALDPYVIGNSSGTGQVGGQPGWGGYGVFTYGAFSGNVGPSPTLGKNTAFVIDSTGNGGVGVNFAAINIDSPVDILGGSVPLLDITAADFPVFDRAAFGANFDPDRYMLELEYRPLPGNVLNSLHVTLDTHDGFGPDPVSGVGKRMGEQFQWTFNDLTAYHAANQNADGFAVIRQGVTNGSGGQTWTFNGPSYIFQQGDGTFQSQHVLKGEGATDFNSFDGLVPNGVAQIHLQNFISATDRLHMEFKGLRIVPRTADPREVARLDARSGVSVRFGSPFTQTDVPINHEGNLITVAATDQIQRFNQSGFTNLILKTDDDLAQAGMGLWQAPNRQIFDGSTAEVEITAQLTVPQGAGQASSFDVILKDMDGNDTGPGLGGEEYWLNVDLGAFNTSTMTTVTLPLADATLNTAFEFTNDGDGLLSNFNLYYLGLNLAPGNGLLNIEIQSIRILQAATVISGDFNGDGFYNCADIDALTSVIAAGSNNVAFDLTGDGIVNLADRDAWLLEGGEANLGPGRAYLLGDGNLDGSVDGSDFGIWNASKFTATDAWCAGDFNADGSVDGSDFGIWNANKFTSADGAAVPEPLCAWGLGCVALWAFRRYRSVRAGCPN